MSPSDETRKLPDTSGQVTRDVRNSAYDKTRLVRRPELPDRDDRAMRGDSTDPKTRLAGRPPAADSPGSPSTRDDSHEQRLVTGWLVVIKGPGRGQFAPVFDGMNSVGRDASQSTRLNFGDDMISRSEHAYITYDFMERRFFIQQGGKPNLVRLNNSPVLQPMEIKTGDQITIGSTELAFMGFCGENFDWQQS